MKISWLIKYYLVGFLTIFSLAYYIENSEPNVNWKLYPEISISKVNNIIKQNKCEEIVKLYEDEYYINYEKNYLGFTVRRDKKLKKGLNYLKFLKYHLKKNNCATNIES